MDDLKKYLHTHRPELDTDEPGEMVWQNVQEELHPKKTRRIPLYLKWVAAASVVLMLGISFIWWQNARRDNGIKGPIVADTNRTQPVKQQPLPPRPIVVIPKEKVSAPVVKAEQPVKKRKPRQPAIPLKAPPPTYGFEGVEASYASMVNMQLERLRSQPIYAEDASYFHAFKKQFADLANEEEQVKQRIRASGMKDEHVDELIGIYQGKINVLKQLQFEINKMNNRVKQSDPSINQRPPSYINL